MKIMKDIFNKIIDDTKKLDVDNYKFELKLHSYINDIKDTSEYFKKSTSFIRKTKNDEEAYRIFFFSQLILRRFKDFKKMEILFQDGMRFNQFKTFNFLKSLYLTSKGLMNQKEAENALSLAQKAYSENINNMGVAHSFVSTFCSVYETFDVLKNSIHKLYFKEANAAINSVIKNIDDNYNPKFYSTFGRILSIEGDYLEAKNQVNKAIAFEDSNKKDYSHRIGDYQRILTRIEVQENINKLDKITEKTNKKINKIPKFNFSILSIFVTIATFAISGVSIAQKYNAQDAALLILITFSSATALLSLVFIPIFRTIKFSILSFLVFLTSVVGIILIMIIGFC